MSTLPSNAQFQAQFDEKNRHDLHTKIMLIGVFLIPLTILVLGAFTGKANSHCIPESEKIEDTDCAKLKKETDIINIFSMIFLFLTLALTALLAKYLRIESNPSRDHTATSMASVINREQIPNSIAIEMANPRVPLLQPLECDETRRTWSL